MQKQLLCVVLLVVFLTFGASAAPMIVGSVNFGSPVANVMIPTLNSATFVGTPSFTVITPGTGDFITSLGMPGTAINIPGNGPLPGFLTFDGFTVDVMMFLGPDVWTKVPLPGGVDFIGLGFHGMVKHAGYADTHMSGSLSAQYSGGYGPGGVVAWSGNINAVPEPATYLLMGAGLFILGLAARRKRAK